MGEEAWREIGMVGQEGKGLRLVGDDGGCLEDLCEFVLNLRIEASGSEHGGPRRGHEGCPAA